MGNRMEKIVIDETLVQTFSDKSVIRIYNYNNI
jgi:hypothetical protein